MRKYYTQRELIEILDRLGFPVTRQALKTWKDRALIPRQEKVTGSLVLYNRDQLITIITFATAIKNLTKKSVSTGGDIRPFHADSYALAHSGALKLDVELIEKVIREVAPPL